MCAFVAVVVANISLCSCVFLNVRKPAHFANFIPPAFPQFIQNSYKIPRLKRTQTHKEPMPTFILIRNKNGLRASNSEARRGKCKTILTRRNNRNNNKSLFKQHI